MTTRKANSGSFKPGPDPRRHELTHLERRAGYLRTAMLIQQGRLPSRVAAHVRRKIRCTASQTGKHRQAEAEEMRRATAKTPAGGGEDFPF